MSAPVLRPATNADAELVFSWRVGLPTVAFQGPPPSPADLPAHLEWFGRALVSAERNLFMVESSGQPLGHLRLDRKDRDTAEVSVLLAPEARRMGLGRAALGLAVSQAARLGLARLDAVLHRDNAASARAFAAAGFTPTGQDEGEFQRWARPVAP